MSIHRAANRSPLRPSSDPPLVRPLSLHRPPPPLTQPGPLTMLRISRTRSYLARACASCMRAYCATANNIVTFQQYPPAPSPPCHHTPPHLTMPGSVRLSIARGMRRACHIQTPPAQLPSHVASAPRPAGEPRKYFCATKEHTSTGTFTGGKICLIIIMWKP